MNKCCESTFVKALEEVLYFIRQVNPDIPRLIDTLEFSIKEIKKREEDDAGKIRNKNG